MKRCISVYFAMPALGKGEEYVHDVYLKLCVYGGGGGRVHLIMCMHVCVCGGEGDKRTCLCHCVCTLFKSMSPLAGSYIYICKACVCVWLVTCMSHSVYVGEGAVQARAGLCSTAYTSPQKIRPTIHGNPPAF